MTEFGASFKKARESLGVSLDQIALETRISTRFLLAIENEEFRHLPGGIFNRGFIRTYAERVGLNPEQAVADYERLARSTEPDMLVGSDAVPPAGSSRGLYMAAVAVLVVLIAAFYIFNRASTPTAVTASKPAVESPAPESPAPAPAAETPAEAKSEPVPVPVETKPPELAANTPPVTTPPVAIATAPSVTPPSPTAGVAAAHDQLALEFEIHETTWIKITTDGMPVLNGELRPGTTRRFTAQTSIKVVVGNAGGLSMKVNDKAMRPLGRSGEVKTITITPENLPSFIG